MPTICFCSPDLASLAVIVNGERSEFAPSSLPDEPTPLDIRARVDEAAEFIAKVPGVRRRVDLLVLDVDASAVHFANAAAPAAPVAAAAVAASTEDWGSLAPNRGVSALADEPDAPRSFEFLRRDSQGAGSKDSGGPAMPILTTPDAVVRLLLDRLDRRGFRTPVVCSLWHAIAHLAGATSGGPRVTAIVDNDRLVYALHDGPRLLAGGRLAVSHAQGTPAFGPTLQRLRLDLLTWSARLGVNADTITVHAPSPIEAGHGGEPRIRPVETEHPAEAAIKAAAEALQRGDINTGDTRLCLARLTNRPNRATRRRVRVATLATACIATAFGIAAYRVGQVTDEHSAARSLTSLATLETVEAAFPQFDRNADNMVVFVRDLNLELEGREEPGTPPGAPRWLIDIGEITAFVQNYPDVLIDKISLRANMATLELRGEGITPEVATQLAADLSTESLTRQWEADARRAASQTITLRATIGP